MTTNAKTREIASSLQKNNTKVMAPITVSFIVGILIYVTVVFQGLVPPGGYFNWQFICTIIFCFIIIGGANVFLFEIWVNRRLMVAAMILTPDDGQQSLSDDEAIGSLIALIEFPRRFIMRFLAHWLIGAPLIIASLRIFYAIPFFPLLYLALGTTSILCLMSAFHYFLIKAAYARPLGEALRKYPLYFERPELAVGRSKYRTKIFIYILILVGSVTWLTTHLSLSGQTRSMGLQRARFLEQRLDSYRPELEMDLFRKASPLELMVKVDMLLGGGRQQGGDEGNERAYLIDTRIPLNAKDSNLIGDPISEIDFAMIKMIPQLGGPPPGWFSSEWTKSFFSLNRILIVRITARVMHAYAQGRDFTISVDPIGEYAQLVTIKPKAKILTEDFVQIGTVIAMLVLAFFLSLLFARFMQMELMNPLDRLIASSKQVAAGDLSNPDPIMADDELGELSVHHMKMVSSLREMVLQISEASSAVDSSAEQIAERTDAMSKGSQAQSAAVEETSSTITEMNQSIGNIAESVENLAASAQESSASILEMSATNEEVAENTEELSLAVEETTSSIEQMSASVKQVAENLQSATGKISETAGKMQQMGGAVKEVEQKAIRSAEMSEQVTKDAESGVSAVQSTIEGIEKIWETSREAAEVINKLGKRAKQIGRILTVIEDVTEETNLLALNAAIIAAQAGDHGRGFSVVADEIKDLAERTHASTAEIAEQIQAVQDDAANAVAAVEKGEESVGKGVLLSEKAGEALRKILESAGQSLELSRTISKSSMEQSRQAGHILSFFENLVEMIGHISTASQEQSRGTVQIINATKKMRDISIQVKKATREQALGSRQITQSIEHITQIATFINSSQSEQKKAAQQVLVSITKIAEIANQNVESVEKVSGAVANLKILSDGLEVMLDTFSMESEEDENKNKES